MIKLLLIFMTLNYAISISCADGENVTPKQRLVCTQTYKPPIKERLWNLVTRRRPDSHCTKMTQQPNGNIVLSSSRYYSGGNRNRPGSGQFFNSIINIDTNGYRNNGSPTRSTMLQEIVSTHCFLPEINHAPSVAYFGSSIAVGKIEGCLDIIHLLNSATGKLEESLVINSHRSRFQRSLSLNHPLHFCVVNHTNGSETMATIDRTNNALILLNTLGEKEEMHPGTERDISWLASSRPNQLAIWELPPRVANNPKSKATLFEVTSKQIIGEYQIHGYKPPRALAMHNDQLLLAENNPYENTSTLSKLDADGKYAPITTERITDMQSFNSHSLAATLASNKAAIINSNTGEVIQELCDTTGGIIVRGTTVFVANGEDVYKYETKSLSELRKTLRNKCIFGGASLLAGYVSLKKLTQVEQ